VGEEIGRECIIQGQSINASCKHFRSYGHDGEALPCRACGGKEEYSKRRIKEYETRLEWLRLEEEKWRRKGYNWYAERLACFRVALEATPGAYRRLYKRYVIPDMEKITQTGGERRKAREKAGGRRCSSAEWAQLKTQYGFRCLACGKAEPEIALVKDHVIPLSAGGKNGVTNLQPLCWSCNATKHDKTIDYRNTPQALGFLIPLMPATSNLTPSISN